MPSSKVVATVPVKVPAGPSVSVTVTVSPLRGLETVTSSVPSPDRSASVTETVRVSPTVPPVIEGVPATPPSIVSVAATVGGEPTGRATSL